MLWADHLKSSSHRTQHKDVHPKQFPVHGVPARVGLVASLLKATFPQALGNREAFLISGNRRNADNLRDEPQRAREVESDTTLSATSHKLKNSRCCFCSL